MSDTKFSAISDIPAPEGAARKRILLVEGDGFTRLVLLLRLRLAGFGVDFTSNGTLGLGKLRSGHPEILLLDLKLCGMSGVQLIKAARAEPGFADRPIYVYTHVNRMNRATRKEVLALATEVFDKASMTREDLVQIFATTFKEREPVLEPASTVESEPSTPTTALSDGVVAGAIEELIRGVREQSEVFVHDTGARAATGAELLSRVSSLASCAKAAGLPSLARHTQALASFLDRLCNHPPAQNEAALSTVIRAVKVMSRIAFEKTRHQPPKHFKVVFIDEAPYSNRAVEEALLQAELEPVCFEEPGRAREYLASTPADIVIANVVLPEGHGLALVDVRHLSLHAKTPVLYGPEAATGATDYQGDLPISAPRLDKAPLLLAELVLRALNELQDPQSSALPTASAKQSAPQPTTGGPAGAAPEADGFELFAVSARKPVSLPATPSSPVSAAAVHNPHRFDHLFAAAGIPNEPIARVEPEATATDGEIEFSSRLPAMPVDDCQTEEQSIEAAPPSSFQAPNLTAAEPEALVAGQTTVDNQAPGVEGDNFPRPAAAEATAEQAIHQVSAVQEPATLVSDYGDVMNHQLHTTSGDYGAAIAEIQPPASAEEQNAQARCAELEQEVAALRQAFEGLAQPPPEAPSGTADASRAQELDERLSQCLAELEKQKEEQRQAEADWQRQLQAATAASQQSALARQQAEARCTHLEQQLAAAPKPQPDNAKPVAGENDKPSNGPWAGASVSELEQQVQQGVAALAKATADLAKERGERQRSQQRAAELNERLQALHQDLGRTLQAQREDLDRIHALEQQHEQACQDLDRCAATLEQQQAEARLVEAQLQKTKEANAQLRKDLSFFEEANRTFDGARQELQSQFEASLSAARENGSRLEKEAAERQKLADNLDHAQRDLQSETRRREALEQELNAVRQELQEAQARLDKEAAERQRLHENQDSLDRNLRDGSERDLEFSKLQSALQLERIERKRQETQLARTRQHAVDAAHAARALRATLRRQIRGPVDNLAHSTRRLLELEMGEEQKKLAEGVLQDVLLVQTRLREPTAAPADGFETTTTGPATAS